MHPAVKEILRFFEFNHLPGTLQPTSQRFHDLAHWIALNVPDSAEKTVALRKLLESKDAAVRGMLPPLSPREPNGARSPKDFQGVPASGKSSL